jgi:hypothetical protein
MTLSAESQKSIDTWLAAFRKQLRDLMDEDARDIVEEIRAHILDKTSADPSPDSTRATLAALGTPEQLAVRYRTDELLQRAQLSRSPAVILRSTLRWATLSLAGLLVFVVSVVGYCIGGILVVAALLKAVFPRHAGLNITHNADTWGLGFGAGSGPATGHDPLGLWLIPIFLLIGGGILFLTFRFGAWSLRKLWRPRARPTATQLDLL